MNCESGDGRGIFYKSYLIHNSQNGNILSFLSSSCPENKTGTKISLTIPFMRRKSTINSNVISHLYRRSLTLEIFACDNEDGYSRSGKTYFNATIKSLLCRGLIFQCSKDLRRDHRSNTLRKVRVCFKAFPILYCV